VASRNECQLKGYATPQAPRGRGLHSAQMTAKACNRRGTDSPRLPAPKGCIWVLI
jgi:hypothetical protein